MLTKTKECQGMLRIDKNAYLFKTLIGMYVVQPLEGIVVQEQRQGGEVIAGGGPAQLGQPVAPEVQRFGIIQLGRLFEHRILSVGH